jgi:acetyl-CoA hydrolase
MDWQNQYTSRIRTAAEAVQLIRSGERIFLTGNCSVPRELTATLVAQAERLTDVEICHALTVGPADYTLPEMAGHLRCNSLFVSASVRPAVNAGRADYTPVTLSQFPLLFKDKILPVDTAFVHLSPPDADGYCTFGIESGLTRTAALSARRIIAEINTQMPRTCGQTKIHMRRLAAAVPVDYPLAELAMDADADNEVVERIAMAVAERIPDGATLQMGIGAIPGAILKYLRDKKDLGVHSELFSDGVVDLVEAGVITNARKTYKRGKIVAGFVLGTQRLYAWVNNNPLVELLPTEVVNSPAVIARNPRVVAINSAIEIDLTGQVCSDSIGARIFSGSGGQLDFIYGAALSPGGLPVIALPSTACPSTGPTLSRIVPTLKTGAGVVTPRSHVHAVVTEYGLVDLYGKSIRQRAQALISIAHPQFRDELERQARALHYFE